MDGWIAWMRGRMGGGWLSTMRWGKGWDEWRGDEMRGEERTR